MKVIIAGSRTFKKYKVLKQAIAEAAFDTTIVVSGGADGVDALGEQYAYEMDLPCHIFEAKWDKYGPSAGPRRNREMAEYADALIALWDGKSKGTKNMIDEATARGLLVYVKMI